MVLVAQFIWGPATFVVLLVVGLLILVGALLLGRSSADPQEARDDHSCQECGQVNPANAKFCARCGRELQGENT